MRSQKSSSFLLWRRNWRQGRNLIAPSRDGPLTPGKTQVLDGPDIELHQTLELVKLHLDHQRLGILPRTFLGAVVAMLVGGAFSMT